MHGLQTFEALARLRSVTLAGDELSVTPSAISHRIRQLEADLGLALFERADFTRTANGAAYLGRVRAALSLLHHVPGRQSPQARPRLRVALTPTFSRQLLLPRLATFGHTCPEIDLVLQVTIPLSNVMAEEADIELH